MPRPRRVHEALEETALELGVSINWLVSKLCEEGLARVDLASFTLVRDSAGITSAQAGR